MKEVKRRRKIKLQFYIDENEREILKKRMALMHTNSFGAFARKMCLDGLMIEVNLDSFKEYGKEVNAIGKNINQAVKKLNSDNYNQEDVEYLKGQVANICQLQRSILSNLH